MIERTPTEFRNSYAEWSEKHRNIPDSKIIPPPARNSNSPRHADLSKELQGLLFWRHINNDIQPLSSNWMTPDNDNNDSKEDDEPRAPLRSTECEHIIRPSVDELVKAVEAVEYDYRCRQIPGGNIPEESWPLSRKDRPLPGPDIERGNEYEACAPLNGSMRPVARMGSIRFATEDSNRNGRKQSPTRGSIVSWHAGPTTHGYFLIDEFSGAKGASDETQYEDDIDNSNQFFADLLDAQPHGFKKGGFCRRGVAKSPLLPATSPSATLNEARAFYGLKPARLPNDNRPALPCGSRNVSDSFLGIHVTPNSRNDGSEDAADEWIIRRQECIAIRSKLSVRDAKVLDTAIQASNFEDIGNAFEFSGKAAQRQGKSLLLAASRNLSSLIDTLAA